MSNIEKIRQEILRRQEYHWEYLPDADSPEDDWTHNELCELGAFKELEHLEEFIDSLPEEKPSDDLEEEVKRYYSDNFTYISSDQPTLSILTNIARHFTEWQREQLLKGSPLPEDTVLFQKGVEEGKRLMMEDAVEGEIGYWNQRGLSIRLDQSLERLGYGEDTEVKIIIVKEDD